MGKKRSRSDTKESELNRSFSGQGSQSDPLIVDDEQHTDSTSQNERPAKQLKTANGGKFGDSSLWLYACRCSLLVCCAGVYLAGSLSCCARFFAGCLNSRLFDLLPIALHES
jgi:hypothetical protein